MEEAWRIILPRWLRYVSRENPEKIIQFGDRVLSMDLDGYHPFEAADRVIDRLDEWLSDVEAWFYLEDLNIPNDPAVFQNMAESAIRMYGGRGSNRRDKTARCRRYRCHVPQLRPPRHARGSRNSRNH